MATNLLKSLLTVQSLLVLEGITLFEILSTLVNQFLLDFHDKQSIITINSHMLSMANLEP
jgi:hypothetical protein